MKYKTFKKQLKENKGIRLWAGDTITICSHEGCISSSLKIEYNHKFFGKGIEVISLPNELQVWELLKGLNTCKYGEVLYKTTYWGGEEEIINYEDSLPYKHRFTI